VNNISVRIASIEMPESYITKAYFQQAFVERHSDH
jgi:hypothetical protein